MACDECIHYGVCEADIEQYVVCIHFKNKADFVEVPCRCKDCRYAVLTTGEDFVLGCQNWGYDDVYCDKNDFCSRGERDRDINVPTK